jgi:hypothetical protein
MACMALLGYNNPSRGERVKETDQINPLKMQTIKQSTLSNGDIKEVVE